MDPWDVLFLRNELGPGRFNQRTIERVHLHRLDLYEQLLLKHNETAIFLVDQWHCILCSVLRASQRAGRILTLRHRRVERVNLNRQDVFVLNFLQFRDVH